MLDKMKDTIMNIFDIKANARKAAYLVMIASWLQIIASIVLAILYFSGNTASTNAMVLILIPVIVIGNGLLMSNAWNILSDRARYMEMLQTIESTQQLNTKLRVQRHDFINHLQVVHSLIQLKEYDEAADYIAEIYEDIRQVGELLKTNNPAVNGLLAAKQQRATEENVPFHLHITARLDSLQVEGWEFCRILSNLIDNALYAAKENEGEVHIGLREDINSVYFSVENDGEIPKRNLEKIFEPGFTTKGERGTGMGLYIIKDTVEKYKGRIQVSTGKGLTRFYGFIPLTSLKSES